MEDDLTTVSETTLISARTVRAELGGISDMTLWRWLQRADLGFPQPIYIARRRYWRRADIEAWKSALSGQATGGGDALIGHCGHDDGSVGGPTPSRR